LLGAGGGGFLLFFVPPDRQEAVKQTLAGLGVGATHVPMHMEEEGSTVVLHRPDLTMNYDRSTDASRQLTAV
jgi:D-glycero-alpha-D-manno-heptose-7-phosphate kinase